MNFSLRLTCLVCLVALSVSAGHAHSQDHRIIELRYEDALQRARETSPAHIRSRAIAREADSYVEAAGEHTNNPELSLSAGPRFGRGGGTTLDLEIAAEQWLEIGGQRTERRAAATAAGEAAIAQNEEEQRLALREVSHAFVTALYWALRTELALENLQIAQDIAAVAAARDQLGESTAIEAPVAQLTIASSQAALDRARAAQVSSEAQLRAILNIEHDIELRFVGQLRELALRDVGEADLSDLPSIRALRAELRQAAAEASLAQASRRPDIGVGACYATEEGMNIIMGTIGIELPIFNRNRGALAQAQARHERLIGEIELSERAAASALSSAASMAALYIEAALRFESEGLPALERVERIAAESFQSGTLPIAQLLTLRNELIQAKLDYAELLFSAAMAVSELELNAGHLR